MAIETSTNSENGVRPVIGPIVTPTIVNHNENLESSMEPISRDGNKRCNFISQP